ncbi:hypothetical protein FQN50_009433 [Emmonsiellopsis sp. PD_5]|nr:hypothetical protein FQN50_009433 [Emmonsiellopsis sp. PD_5]
MVESKPNPTGDSNPQHVPHGNWDSFPWEPFPAYAGTKSNIFRSADGRVVAGAYRESGVATLTYPCDEFFIVTDGWIKLAIHGGDTFTMNKGDFIYIQKGQTIDFEFGPNFANAAVFINHDEKVTLC